MTTKRIAPERELRYFVVSEDDLGLYGARQGSTDKEEALAFLQDCMDVTGLYGYVLIRGYVLPVATKLVIATED